MYIFSRNRSFTKIATIIILVFTCHTSFCQSRYNPSVLFPALPLLPAGNEYRTATGEPGPAYWQNQSDYVIDVTLDDQQNLIKGIVTITYTNNSPRPLSSLWLQLDQNVYKQNSRGILSGLFQYKNPDEQVKDGGFEIEEVKLTDNSNIAYDVYDTRMKLSLSEPLKKGQQLTFRVKYNYLFPVNYKNADFQVNRTDIMPSKNGNIYAVAQWYPRMCVLDDVEGWNTLPYLGNGEFYLDFGNFQVNITLPSSYLVEASGDLMNPEEVLTPVQLKRWQSAKESSGPVFIRSAKEVLDASSRPAKPTCTWKFRMDRTRDFAWTASKSFIWEVLNFRIGDGKPVTGSSLYPVESEKRNSWSRSSEYIRFTLQHFSQKWFPYPFNKAVNVASNLDGMEYPGMVFCSAKDTGNMYWAVVNHELGHTWFPMVVGSNERKYAWMDEGFNLFIDNIATREFNKAEFAGYAEIDMPVAALFADTILPILTRPDAIPGNQVYPIQYQKVAYLLALLRNEILGTDRFDHAFRKYIRDWAYKHPTPWDFFRSMNASTGEDLTWFWKSMFIENFRLDQRIAKVETTAKNKTLITIENIDRAAMPLVIDITYTNGLHEKRSFPVEIWENGASYTFAANKDDLVSKVLIDPDQVYPDVNRGNNIYDLKR
ncbi:M1 family peptidase [Chitinophaga oryziterrae]|uniref:M1 family peptidase n=1 Tax=Chitinophaga oryziterrae TaxID=1031224 RepID=A0A6N8JIG8_9BACT|nr:M1 family metallopeptidase [Chitinophaga oryziterrae]MVT45027.1 M1 family peptidase [Chitinophaga oryziterrae]